MCLHKPTKSLLAASAGSFSHSAQTCLSPSVAPAYTLYCFDIILIGMEREVQQLVEMVRVCGIPPPPCR